MLDRKEMLCWLLLCQFLLLNIVHTAKLADSGYPMDGANPQRNYQFNRKVLCPTVSGGKTTILNTAWVWPPPIFPFQWDSAGSEQITLDEEGYIYFTGYIQGESIIQQKLFKIHISGNDSLTTSANTVPLEQSVYTHVQGGIFYSANDNATFAWDPNLILITRIDNAVDSAGVSSVAPLGTNYLVKSNGGSDTDPIPALTFIKVPENTVDTSNVNTNFVVGYTNPVMVFKNSTHEFPIVVSNTSPATVTSQYYNISLPRESARAMIDGSEIISITQSPDVTIYRISAETGAILEQKSVTIISDGISVQDASKFLYHNGFSIADASIGDAHALLDLYNNAIVLESTSEVLTQPTYSTVDNVVVTSMFRNSLLQFWAVGWGTWEIKMKAAIPGAQLLKPAGMPIFSEDCKMHVVVDDALYTLEPLPIQNVVPILECIDPDMSVGYFSYDNLGQREFNIPPTYDRNFIAAVNDTPIISFQPGRGPKFPLSSSMSLSLENKLFTWQLENYILGFNPSDSKLLCPTTVNVTIVLRADAPFPIGFDQKVREAFVTITGISDSRVTIVTNSKRSITQTSELETELAIAPDPNNLESSASQVVAEFAANQQDAFNQQIANANGAPDNVAISSVTTKALATEIRGSAEPSSPLAAPMVGTTEPQSNTQVPQSETSSANFSSVFVSVATGIPFLFFWSLIDN